MRLAFDEEFEETIALGEDSPHIKALEETAQRISGGTAAAMNTEELLDVMEDLNSLMNYYSAGSNYKRLEPVMRKQQELLDLCKEKAEEHVGYIFWQMSFWRINALLYAASGKQQQSLEYYKKGSEFAKKCFSLLEDNEALSDPQKLYVGWNCILLLKEVSDTEEKFAHHENSVECLEKIMPMLVQLEPLLWHTTDMREHSDLYDRVAELYGGIGGVLYAAGDIINASKAYQNAINLYESIDEQVGSDFFRARAIWIKSNYGLQRFVFLKYTDILDACQRDVDSYLVRRNPSERDRAIVESALGTILLGKGCSYQLSGDMQNALEYSQKACHYFETSLATLEHACEDAKSSYGKTVLTTMSNQIYGQLLSGLDTIGVQYYGVDDYENSEEALLKAVALINDKPQYCVGESNSMVVQAECYQYLALISANKDDEDQTIFYGKHAAALASQAADATNNPNAIGLALTANGLLAQIYLAMKDKPMAKQYAQTGLLYCERLRVLAPDDPHLQMEAPIQQLHRKASRRFF